MTNKEEDEQPSCDAHMAAFLAANLVSQVLDDAYIIANTANDTGTPWSYITSLKLLKTGHIDETHKENVTFTVSRGNYVENSKTDEVITEVVTSTPQKVENQKPNIEMLLIGQGDGEIEKESDLRKSTSMFINRLFDMSDVENLINYDDSDATQSSHVTNSSIFTEISKIIDSCIVSAFDKACELEPQMNKSLGIFSDCENSIQNLSNSLLSNTFVSDKSDNVALLIDSTRDASNDVEKIKGNKKDENVNEVVSENKVEVNNNNYISSFENAYLTFNRDYEQYSDEEPVLQDPKGLSFQEIELKAAHPNNENITGYDTFKETAEKATTSRMSTSAPSTRKRRLVTRCRVQGQRLFACIRGWWGNRKVEGKHKTSIRGSCPISVDACRRTTSLLDQRHLRLPSPNQHVWKYNTINESLVQSSRWKQFGFKATYHLNEC